MDIVHPQIEEFIRSLGDHGDPVLAEMEQEAERRRFPIVGSQVGRLLYILTRASGFRRVFEMGSGYGYSAYWFARALPEDGEVFLTEGGMENTRRAREYLERAGLSGKVRFNTGDARDILRQTPGEFDVVFIDIDKEQYPEAWDLARSRVRRGGMIITDNVLWGGKVATDDHSPSTEAIRQYLRLAYGDKGFFTVIVPIRDGVAVSYRVG